MLSRILDKSEEQVFINYHLTEANNKMSYQKIAENLGYNDGSAVLKIARRARRKFLEWIHDQDDKNLFSKEIAIGMSLQTRTDDQNYEQLSLPLIF